MNQDSQLDFEISISKGELAELPQADYFGTIQVIDKVKEAKTALSALRKSRIIGFDTETRPSFKKGYSNKVSLLQLSTPKKCYLFRLNKIGLMPEIKSLLEDASKLKVGLSIHDDFRNLRRLADIEPEGFVDLQKMVRDYNIIDRGLQRIYGILFGKRISKSQCLTNWEADELTHSQKCYAAMDALACVKIYDYLKSGKFHPENSEYILPPVVDDKSCESTEL